MQFAMPSITTGIIKTILSKKNTTSLKTKSFEILKMIILKAISDNLESIKCLLDEMESNQKIALINSIKNIGNNISIPNVDKPTNITQEKFKVIINKDWIINASGKINSCLDAILKNITILDFNHNLLCDSIIDFSISLLKNCYRALNNSNITLLKLLFAPYFMGNRPILSFSDFSTFLNEVHIANNSSIQEEFIYTLQSIRKIKREVDSHKQREILCTAIGFSWTISKLDIIPIIAEKDLMSIHNSLHELLELNRSLVIEVIEPLPGSNVPIPQSQRISFLKKSVHGSLMKMLKHFNTNQLLYDDLYRLLSTLPESLRLSLFNYTIFLLNFDNLVDKEIELHRVIRELIILKSLAKESKELQYKLLSGVMKYSKAKLTSNNTTGDLMFIICDCICDIISDDCLLKFLKAQEQNTVIIQLFEFLSSPHQNVRLNAELAYILICEKLGPNLIEDRYHALIDLLLQKIKYFYFETKTESAISIISSLIETTPELFARSLSSVLESLIRCFDKYYQDEFMWIIENYVPMFLKVLKYADSHKILIISTNLVRQIL